jgi:pyruvate,orthophosphate dikinase
VSDPGPLVVPLDGVTALSRELLGNKGYGINAMRRLSLPVPPAFAITTEVASLDDVWDLVCDQLAWLERVTSRSFGAGPRPLLVSVRSGAAQSMPGMLDTVLDVGIDDGVQRALAASASPRFAADTRQRFEDSYRRIVLGGDSSRAVPAEPLAQLRAAAQAVLASWHSARARTYRAHHGLDDSAGTAVVVQAMVFGNMDRDSGTGVLFSRNPTTGSDEPFGEWLPGGQGEDVVSGTVDVEPVTALRFEQPHVYDQLMTAAKTLEAHGRDVADIEFTVEDGTLWLLQTRVAKRSAQAAVRLALTFRGEGLIDDQETLRRVTPAHVRTLLVPGLQPEERLTAPLLATGLAACPGVVSGRVYTDVDAALDAADDGEDVILVRPWTSPEDVAGMIAARGVVTEVGGATSHAAVVSREIGRPAVVGCGAGVANALAGQIVTVDGTEGEVRQGNLALTAWDERDSADLGALADLARTVSPLRAHLTGDHPAITEVTDATVAELLASGVTDVVTATPLLAMLTALHLGGSG